MMNTRAGVPRANRKSAAAGTPARTVLIASDWAPIRTFDTLIRNEPEAVYGDLLPLLRRDDLRIVNCECALTSARHPVWKSGATFKGEPEHVRGLTAVPFDVACLANNHVLDYGVTGLRESLRVLHRNGIRTVGAGLTEKQAWEPLRVSIGDSRIAVVNISEGEDLTTARGAAGVCGWDHARTLSTIRQCKREGAFVIVIAHCGVEYIPFPPPYVAQEFRSMVDAGADCVIGHHPHVPQGIEWRRKRPVVYSMGNFVFYQFTDLYYRKTGFFVRIGVSGNSLSGFSVHPYRINEHGLQALAGAEARSFRRKLAVLSAPLSRPRGVEKAWSAYLDYYGTSGFTAEVQGILAKLKEEPEKGAAMFRNRLTTLQHAELWRDFLTRIMAGTVHSPSAPITRLIREWFARKAVSGAA